MTRTVYCIKLNKEADGLDLPPYPGELGKRILTSVSKQAWAAWLKHQTMLVNENRLNLADAQPANTWPNKWKRTSLAMGPRVAAGYTPPSA